jgi:hypothetical protein
MPIETDLDGNGAIDIQFGGTNAKNEAGARINLGLGNVNNTSDADKPISAATQTALDGFSNVDNTSDADKPISTATQSALDTKIPDFNVNDMFGLINISIQNNGDVANIAGFFAVFPQSEFNGGGNFTWQSGLNKNTANGGTVVDPDNTGGFDGTTSTLAAFLTAQGGGSGTGCWVRQYTILTPEMFGAIPDASDSTTALQAFLDALKLSGGYASNNGGVYGVSARLVITSGTKAFTLMFTGRDSTEIRRITDFSASVFEVSATDDCQVGGFTINAQHATYPNGNHGFVFSDCSDVRGVDILVTDYKNSGCIAYANTPGTDVNNVFIDCTVNGLAAANNGLLVADLARSGLINCVGDGCPGSPGYALQLKNACDDGFIINSIGRNSAAGVAFGKDGVTTVNSAKVSARVEGNTTGFVLGGAEDCSVDIKIDMKSAGANAIDLEDGSDSNDITASVLNMAASVGIVRTRSGAIDNFIRLKQVNGLSTSKVAIFDSGSLNNHVVLEKIKDTVPSAGPLGFITDNSTGGTNIFELNEQPMFQKTVIASGVINLSNRKVESVVLDTEGSAGTDDLDTINGDLVEGLIVSLRTTSNVRDVTVKHATGNIILTGSVDFTLNAVGDTISLRYNSELSQWAQINGNNIA